MSESFDLEVNGISYSVTIDQGKNLLSVIREDVGLTGTKEGCDDCECGACMVLLDGQPVNSCSFLAVQAQGRTVTTIEGVMQGDEMHALQRNLLDAGGVQCGFCTPGMIMSAHALLDRNANPTPEDVKIGLSGNLCRCTGYAKILAAVEKTAAE
ncbi:MAG: (2Fe-2S)-binding protein [Acidimicrobiaceae bacterium]|jgi:aerobic-type carbon monoxide dehydrogenase small subunit (CoxS/CutS family)|nr:(2Fe-2S)-binding protein [Acidimicrobiaceae bacterium]MBT5579539.1 (2Fe-2S)-binding protein [Acidimicrobiaceae bacterium]MBT5851814.1 (2Fe-2S)-binding protein [Acidimicrobiaceae bacterium]MDG1412235.1 (2Fe-2S)-binding protein [Acidimicrobiales bacterium]MDG2217429.1 (2Fe-2S)-binding protein [Acidimicrobiales bacterium]